MKKPSSADLVDWLTCQGVTGWGLCVCTSVKGICVCLCVFVREWGWMLFFFFQACDVTSSVTDAGMQVLGDAAVRNFKGVCVLKAVCEGLTAILTVQWVFLTFIYSTKGFAEYAFSVFQQHPAHMGSHLEKTVFSNFKHTKTVSFLQSLFIHRTKPTASNLHFQFVMSVDFSAGAAQHFKHGLESILSARAGVPHVSFQHFDWPLHRSTESQST